MSSVLRNAGLAAILVIVVLASQPASASWVTRTVHGYEFAMAVETLLATSGLGEPRQARVMDHRIVVSVREPETAQAVQITAVRLDVAEEGYEGEVIPMREVERGRPIVYDARVRLRRGVPHRILVRAIRDGGARTLEAQFEYRHHH